MKINKISVVVCTYNRLDYLKKCLASLQAVDFANYEVIVVNDASTDGTKQFLDDIKFNNIRVVHHKHNQGIAASRNSGVKAARYSVIAFTDDDCKVTKNWLTELSKGFNSNKIGFVIGRVVYVKEGYLGYFPERLIQNPQASWPMGCNIAYRKEVFRKCGGFDVKQFPDYHEDREMAIRAISRGYQYASCPSATIYHMPMDWTTKSLLNSARAVTAWPKLKRKHPKTYQSFKTPFIKFGVLIHPEDYLYLMICPVLIPVLLIRYKKHGKTDFKIFFVRWPMFLILRRYHIYRQAIRCRTIMF